MSEQREGIVVPRLAAITLVMLAALQVRADVVASMFTAMPRAGLAIVHVLGGAVVLACLAVLVVRLQRRWAIAALVAMVVGWVAHSAALEPFARTLLDATLVQGIATLSALAIGAALAGTIEEARARHSAMVLLVGYAVFGALTALTEHRIGVCLDYPTLVALRKDRDFTSALSDVALAGVLWFYGRAARDAGLDRRAYSSPAIGQ